MSMAVKKKFKRATKTAKKPNREPYIPSAHRKALLYIRKKKVSLSKYVTGMLLEGGITDKQMSARVKKYYPDLKSADDPNLIAQYRSMLNRGKYPGAETPKETIFAVVKARKKGITQTVRAPYHPRAKTTKRTTTITVR